MAQCQSGLLFAIASLLPSADRSVDSGKLNLPKTFLLPTPIRIQVQNIHSIQLIATRSDISSPVRLVEISLVFVGQT
ncbi:hypothetical protein [Scytonema sp. NUACC21]